MIPALRPSPNAVRPSFRQRFTLASRIAGLAGHRGTPGPRRSSWAWLLLVGLLVLGHGCHADEDDEPSLLPFLRQPPARQAGPEAFPPAREGHETRPAVTDGAR
jgi:hypothetical protein